MVFLLYNWQNREKVDLLKLDHVTFNYADHVILKDINFIVHKSEIILLDGPSGIGKSTLCRLLSGYQRPLSGNIYLNDSKLTKPNRSILYIPQDDDLFEWHTLSQHFDFIASLVNTKLPNTYLLEILGLSSLLYKYPKELSGGQKKKAQIYKSYLINPELIIFDETFSAIDQMATDQIISEFAKIWKKQGNTVVFVSHHSQNIRPYVNRIIKIENQTLVVSTV